jgi:hypothetical protein
MQPPPPARLTAKRARPVPIVHRQPAGVYSAGPATGGRQIFAGLFVRRPPGCKNSHGRRRANRNRSDGLQRRRDKINNAWPAGERAVRPRLRRPRTRNLSRGAAGSPRAVGRPAGVWPISTSGRM